MPHCPSPSPEFTSGGVLCPGGCATIHFSGGGAAPLVTQGTEAVPLAEVCPLVAEDSGAAESDAPLDDSLTWAERVELEDAGSSKLSPWPSWWRILKRDRIWPSCHPVHPSSPAFTAGPGHGPGSEALHVC